MRTTSVALLALLGGCPDRTIASVVPQQGKVETLDIPLIPRRDIDILFVIDDSLSMKEEQTSLRANFPRFVSVLESIEGGLPNVQLGVITPNLGTSALDGTTAPPIGSCVGHGEGGALRTLGTGGPRFLRNVAREGGGRDTNYGALSLTQAFEQLATVGTAGCGIEQHLEAMKRALDGSNAVNAGFVRDDAYLAVIVIADEDDCSLAKSSLFAGTQDATYADVVNFRCTSHGVACDTPATPFEMATGVREDCHPRDDSELVASVDRYVEFLKSRKADPRDVIVAGIVGDPAPFAITKKQISETVQTTVLARSCPRDEASTGQLAFPAVRTADFLAQFANTARTTICDDDLSDGLTEIAALLKGVIDEPCFRLPLADVSDAPGAQYDCSVLEVRRHPNAADEELGVLPACDRGAPPCWRIEEDAVQCAYTPAPHLKLVIDRTGAPPATPDLRIKASCVTSGSAPPLQ